MEVNCSKMDFPPRREGPAWQDRSLWVLFLSNLFTLVLAVMRNWRIEDVMWIYWGQSVIIGFFNVKRMLALREFSTEEVTIDGRPVPADRKTQVRLAVFFAAHYGFFHLAYMVFLIVLGASSFSKQALAGNGLCLLVFFFNHAFSFRRNLENDLARKPNIGSLMFFPYARIIPMHVAIIFGSLLPKQGPAHLVFFLSLKTAADLTMHVLEHRGLPGRPGGKKSP